MLGARSSFVSLGSMLALSAISAIAACGSEPTNAPSDALDSGGASSALDAGAAPGEGSGAIHDAGASADAASPPDGATYRSSLSHCWSDAACTRALAISHGGDWSFSGPPYDSNTALDAAYDHGADGVKIDVRVTADDVPVIAHSSPIQSYESLDCVGKKIEEMTAAQVTACHRLPGSETFQRLDDTLDRLRGKLVAQLCVKLTTDFQRTIQEVLAKSAQDFAFIEVDSRDYPLIPTLTGHDQIYYVVNVESRLDDVDTVLGYADPRIIMIELDPTVSLDGMAATKLHPAGVRAFTYDNSDTATESTLQARFDDGYDVVSSNLTAPDVQARITVNTARGVSPP